MLLNVDIPADTEYNVGERRYDCAAFLASNLGLARRITVLWRAGCVLYRSSAPSQSRDMQYWGCTTPLSYLC